MRTEINVLGGIAVTFLAIMLLVGFYPKIERPTMRTPLEVVHEFQLRELEKRVKSLEEKLK